MATNCGFENGKNYSIQLEISNNKPTVQFDSKWKTTIRTTLLGSHLIMNQTAGYIGPLTLVH